jgi:hypothetical protein
MYSKITRPTEWIQYGTRPEITTNYKANSPDRFLLGSNIVQLLSAFPNIHSHTSDPVSKRELHSFVHGIA